MLLILLLLAFFVIGLFEYLYYRLTLQTKRTEISDTYNIKTLNGYEIHIIDKDMQVYVLDDGFIFDTNRRNQLRKKMIKNRTVNLTFYGMSTGFGLKYRLTDIELL